MLRYISPALRLYGRLWYTFARHGSTPQWVEKTQAIGRRFPECRLKPGQQGPESFDCLLADALAETLPLGRSPHFPTTPIWIPHGDGLTRTRVADFDREIGQYFSLWGVLTISGHTNGPLGRSCLYRTGPKSFDVVRPQMYAALCSNFKLQPTGSHFKECTVGCTILQFRLARAIRFLVLDSRTTFPLNFGVGNTLLKADPLRHRAKTMTPAPVRRHIVGIGGIEPFGLVLV
ncbi:hypothetical protein B0H17DRAFT_1152203 [Mycena rosella]|uniref:Uncharacterized protein n=1 Tax=Mycena rosella TaxID=1033263 RepID=A0AAD7BET8_MYCRO|nr:hypothetical protein B0H17DRAFT_1152203 [Mycena rosella]